MISFMKEHKLVTIPDYLGRFEIRSYPKHSSRPARADL
jgi:hypothetical protein